MRVDDARQVPNAPGLYAFTVEDEHQMRVACVGRTGHLWMVTRDSFPAALRVAQRYGRPRHGCDAPAGQHPHRRAAAGRARGTALGLPVPLAALRAEEWSGQ
jgi:hypothetical protein